jgi:chorismate dehydratase
MARWRVGVVSFLLGRPLCEGLDEAPEVDLCAEVPSLLADRLVAGELDAALIPVFEILRHDLFAVRGPCVACEGRVESIRLYHRVPLGEIRTLALDANSRTSANMVGLVLGERYGVAPESVVMPPDLPAMLSRCDAALLIGDSALLDESEHPYLDLGAEWLAMTGLPFVFALWAMPAADEDLAARLRVAWRAGLASLSGIARVEAERRGLDVALLTRYLGGSIHYEMDARKLAGLAAFARRCAERGLLPPGREAVRLVG